MGKIKPGPRIYDSTKLIQTIVRLPVPDKDAIATIAHLLQVREADIIRGFIDNGLKLWRLLETGKVIDTSSLSE